jgi:ubiquinone/menaquinone biosynthesis C-methylase UbiE
MPMNDAIGWHSQLAGEFDQYYIDSPDFIERYKIWTKLIDDYSNHDNYVLDIGCGTGIFSFYSAERNGRVIGIDANDDMLAVCKKKQADNYYKNIIFMKSDIGSLKTVIHDKVDLILCSSVLEYVNDFDRSLAMLCSLLKKNGIFIFSLPNWSSLYRKIEPIIFRLTGKPRYYKYVKNVFTLNEVVEKLKSCGLHVLENLSYSKTPLLSKLFDKLLISQYSNNLFLIVAQRHREALDK